MQNDARLLQETILRIMSQVGFLFGEPSSKDALGPPTQDAVLAQIGFAGPRTGELSLALSSSTAIEFTVNYLGLEQEPEAVDDFVLDAVGEFLNIASSHLLEKLLGEDAVFKLSLPKTQLLDLEGWTRLGSDPASLGLTIESAPALVRLKTN